MAKKRLKERMNMKKTAKDKNIYKKNKSNKWK